MSTSLLSSSVGFWNEAGNMIENWQEKIGECRKVHLGLFEAVLGLRELIPRW